MSAAWSLVSQDITVLQIILLNNNAITQLEESLDNCECVDTQNIKWSINVNIVESDLLRRRPVFKHFILDNRQVDNLRQKSMC